jgi:hypothetical protein
LIAGILASAYAYAKPEAAAALEEAGNIGNLRITLHSKVNFLVINMLFFVKMNHNI